MKSFMLSFVVILFSIHSVFSQILLNNPSFENGDSLCLTSSIGYIPNGWEVCNPRIGNCMPTETTIHPYPSVIDGDYVLILRYDYGEDYGVVAQKIECGFKHAVEYNFKLWHTGFYNDAFPGLFVKGRLHIWLGSDTCDYAQLIYRTKPLDTIWHYGHINFIPENDYDWLILAIAEVSDTTKDKASNVYIDNLSSISVVNANELEATAQDTLYMERKLECINLSATASASMDSVWWEQVGVGVISQQLNAGVVCVDSNATFIVHGLGADSTCAGYLPSSDTVRVRFYDLTSINSPPTPKEGELKIYPNPAKDFFTIEAEESGIFQLYNQLGQMVLTKVIYKGSYSTLDVSGFGRGVYYYTFLSDGEVSNGKVVKE